MPEKILIVCWDSYSPMLKKASEMTGTDVIVIPFHVLERHPEAQERVIEAMRDSDISLFYKSTQSFWNELDDKIRSNSEGKRIMSFGIDPTYFALTNVDHSERMIHKTQVSM